MPSLPILAQVIGGSLSIVQWAILIVGLAGICALVMIALRKLGIAIPDWVVQAFWVVIVVVVIIGLIILLSRFTGIG